MRVSKTPGGTIFASEEAFRKFIRQKSSCDNYFSITDNPFYGKINSSGDIVYLSEKYLSTLPTKNNEVIHALNFVVDAFNDFKRHYQKAINSKVGQVFMIFMLMAYRACTILWLINIYKTP